ncbi:MAG TPA: phospholipase D-like domain-containing protein [Longimicrobiales bacterium]
MATPQRDSPAARGLRRRLGDLFQRALRRTVEAPLTFGNAATLLVDGPAAFPAMLNVISRAQRRIIFENYIIRDDDVGRRFAGALAERARSGVEVLVLYDWLGCRSTGRAYWQELRRAGCHVRCFAPPSLRHPLRVLRRDHRKLVLADARVAIVGGLCIGNEWDDVGDGPPWRDTAVLIEGPIAHELDRSFARIWQRAGGHPLPPLNPTEHGTPGSIPARVVDGPPAAARAYRLYQLIAALASRSIYITGSYPLAPAPLRRALASAARAGVDVRLLAPGRSDVPIINEAARARYGSLLRAGVRIYEWNGPMLHAKTVVADGTWALIGSTNLNPFSLLGTYELDVEIQDRGIASQLERQFLADLENATEITLDAWRSRPRARRIREHLAAALLWFPHRLYSG